MNANERKFKKQNIVFNCVHCVAYMDVGKGRKQERKLSFAEDNSFLSFLSGYCMYE